LLVRSRAPDEWQKYDISGCGADEIAVPNPAAEAQLLPERHRTTFVLRQSRPHLLALGGLLQIGAA
jgi:hypothetical protein